MLAVPRKKQPKSHPDPEWLDLANAEVGRRGRGEPQRLAHFLNVHTSTSSRILAGTLRSPELLLRMSIELGIRPPRTIPFEEHEWQSLRVMVRISKTGGLPRLRKVIAVLEDICKRVETLNAMAQATEYVRVKGGGKVPGLDMPDPRAIAETIESIWASAGFGEPLPDAQPAPYPSETDLLMKKVEKRAITEAAVQRIFDKSKKTKS